MQRPEAVGTVVLESCKGASGAPDLDPCSQSCRTKRHLQFSPQSLERVIHAAFFILGMGLMAPLTAILQTMDYLNIFFAKFYPSRTLYTAYNTCNLVALVILFKWGDRIWPNKRSRMVTGYSLYTCILAALPLMDFIIIDHGHHMAPAKAMQLAFTVWAVGSCVAGFSDAFISTVAYSQAASIGQRYTHAFVGGRATSGLVMAALRCLSKGALRQNLTGLRQSTSIYVMIAALIVLTSVLIAGILLPRLAHQIEAMNKPTVTVTDATQHNKCTVCRLKAQKQQHSGLAAKGSLPLVTAKSGKAGLPIPPAGPLDSRLSTWGSCSPLLTETSGAPLVPAHSLDQHRGRTRFSSQCGGGRSSVWGTRPLAGQNSYDLREQQHTEGLAQVLDAALPSAAGAGADFPHSQLTQQLSIAEEKEDGQPPSPPCASPPCIGSVSRSEFAMMSSPHRHHHNSPIAEVSSEGSSQPSTPPSAVCVDADVVVLTGKHSIELAAKDSTAEQKPELIVARDSSAKDQHMVVYLQSYITAAQSVASELSSDAEPHCTCGHNSSSKDIAAASTLSSGTSESGDSLASSSIGDSWWSLLKVVWPFLLAVQPAPMTTAAILPLNLSSQVANWPVATAARWHVQIMMVTVQIGFFLGSAVLPIRTPRRPRVTLLCMACLMFLFAPCFAGALMAHARPYVFLALALCMHTYSGYMTSTVFCVASQGFASKDVVRVQQLLVLSMGVSYVVGSCVSWIWVFIGRP